MAVYDDVKRALQDFVAPQLSELRGDMESWFAKLETEMEKRFGRVENEMEKRFAQVDARFAEVRSEIGQFRAEFRQEISNIHTDLVRIEQVFSARLQTVEVVERVARLEERLART